MAVPSTYDSGTFTPSTANEETIETLAIAGTFQFHVNLTNMVDGDVTTLRVYRTIIAGGDPVLKEIETFYGAQSVDAWDSLPYANSLAEADALKLTIEQDFGTLRAYEWRNTRIA